MTYTPAKTLTFDEFIAQYGDDPRYELIDGELRDMEPTGPHEAVAGKIVGRIYTAILHTNLNWVIGDSVVSPSLANPTNQLSPCANWMARNISSNNIDWERQLCRPCCPICNFG